MEALIIIAISAFTLLINIPLGMWRGSVRKFSFTWFVAVHASVPVVIALRIWLDITSWAIPFLIALAIFGQNLGANVYKDKFSLQKVKKISEK